MKRIWAASLWGSLAGLLTAATLLLAILLVILKSHGLRVDAETAGVTLVRTLGMAGPGALLLGALLSGFLLRGHEGGRPRSTSLALGALLGLPMGLIALIAALGIFGRAGELVTLLHYPFMALIYLAAALGGGAVFGLACAWWISRPERKTP